ncbi:MAG: hypothetical protein IPJ89_04980 [Candidatus Iainarchaeum archaeon]|uniref:Uncharacterized protein n=1 Tax=Candidatus Iainarchaeum sp. TaxID=3101447 RepID=A0A7T9DJJ8_9ARCH|nr:MAG: hypothetical protein IPJ89_04980 [Candidatus Diapherotrites archaeon]
MYDAPPDSPFEYEPQPQSSNPLGGAQELAQKHGKKIIALAIIGLLGFFVYDYFIGSQVKLTISARDTEGKLLTGMPGALYESGADKPIQRFEGTTTIGVRPGTYFVEWDSEGSDFAVPENLDIYVEKPTQGNAEQEEKTIFVKDLGVTISQLDFPTTIVRGQQGAKGSFLLKNDSTKGQSIELVMEGGLAPFKEDIQFTPATFSIPAKRTLLVNFTLNVSDTLPITNKTAGDKKNGSIRIKYTQEKESLDFTQFNDFKFDVNPTQTITLNAKADELKSTRFTIRNRSPNDSSEKIDAEIIITQTDGTNAAAEVPEWFSWSIEKPFKALAKNETISPELRFRAPITASKDLILGKVRFFTSFWESESPFTINLTEAVVDVTGTIDGAKSKTYTLRHDTANPTQFQFQTATLRVENKSGFPIATVLYELSTGCEEYISLVTPDFFPIINLPEKGKPNSTQSTQLKINAPSTALPGAEKTCTIQLTYEDPRTQEPAQISAINVQIST